MRQEHFKQKTCTRDATAVRSCAVASGFLCCMSLFLAGVLHAEIRPIRYSGPVSAWPEVKRADLFTAFPIYMEEISQDLGLAVEALVPETAAQIPQQLEGNEIDGIMVQFTDLVRLQNDLEIEPAVCVVQGGQNSEQIYLITDPSSKSVADLEGSKLIVPSNREFPQYFLQSLIDEACQTRPESFFGEIESAEKQVNAVISVIRRKADACLVTRTTFETMQAMSPHLTNRLNVVAKSPEYPRATLAFRGGFDRQIKEQVILFLTHGFKKKARTRQVLVLFKVESFCVYDAGLYQEARAIVEKFGVKPTD
ncbi:phosphate/phosphite/phosphonate ABC transporter substrate-binding protein [Novipirellula artificiosorum]|uniref:ABC transporter, phosphonate, periplasmic substrate-binding protein n=1 Tax=Novipirellula artificiosorum TaxID=2528016 RepID=A0A5C6DLZ1_9BACT|nr:PhnD/SsuA/transferrin family substrate-binding protein [Novipirellula artificiosorum]TWU35879.1 ABC transporter, phosphonate, periplasmic substrate-binding protein [Novipirellula artificiosorum]